jgi:predicted deacylase
LHRRFLRRKQATFAHILNAFAFPTDGKWPHSLITGGVRGNEVESIAAIWELDHRFDSNPPLLAKPRKRLMLVSIINEAAVQVGFPVASGYIGECQGRFHFRNQSPLPRCFPKVRLLGLMVFLPANLRAERAAGGNSAVERKTRIGGRGRLEGA